MGCLILTGSFLLLEKDKHRSNKGCYFGHRIENPPRICGSGVIRKCEKQCGVLSSGLKETEQRGGHEHVIQSCLCERRE